MAKDDGATRDYYNRDALLPWHNYMGDWQDAASADQGPNAYGEAAITDNDTPKWIGLDATTLVQQWVNNTLTNKGMLLHCVGATGPHDFRSSEYSDPAYRPRLVVVSAGGTNTLSPEADTYLEPSTYQCFGDSEKLRVGGNNNALLRFSFDSIAPSATIAQATLQLYDFAQYGALDVGVFRCSQGHELPESDAIRGLASRYIMDAGIAGHPDVVFFTGFESDNWDDEWTSISHPENGTNLISDPPRLFVPFSGKAVRSRIPSGSNSGMTPSYGFQSETGSEPEEIYFRYYLRFGDSWNPNVDGGKMPGISGTYGVAGWGGRPSDGTNGWSARGNFGRQTGADNPLGDKDNPMGYYCYHADMGGQYGDIWRWILGYRGFLENNHWYCIEEYAKMNTPGANDGILRAWVDGRLAFEKIDVRFRDVDTLKIEKIWMNVYHGGTAPAPADMDLYFDNVVIAKRYIGPASLDTDGDGLPDFWETKHYGGNTNASAGHDSDQDGQDNLCEFRSGTDPTNILSVLKITDIASPSNGCLVIEWQSVSNRTYDVDRRTNLLQAFDELTNGIQGLPGDNAYTDMVQGAGPYFYRVRTKP